MREGKHFDSKRGERRNMRGRHLSTPERRRRLPDVKPKFRQIRGSQPQNESDAKEYRYYVLWKPYGVAARNDDVVNARPLRSYVPIEGISPVGFLDANSEGVLLLTDDPRFRYGLNHAKCQEMRIFLAQVELAGNEEMVSDQALDAMAEGVALSEGKALPLEAEVIEDPQLPERSLPVKEDKNTCWLAITCSEGWSRHIRRITAALGYPTLRLVQWAVGPVSLYEMTEGQLRELQPREMHWVRSVLERTPKPLASSERSGKKTHRPGKTVRKNKRWAVKEDRLNWQDKEVPAKRGGNKSSNSQDKAKEKRRPNSGNQSRTTSPNKKHPANQNKTKRSGGPQSRNFPHSGSRRPSRRDARPAAGKNKR